jgi:glutamate-1-semialdehyde 2,1-aminomutase
MCWRILMRSDLYKKAQSIIPGGVNSPVRAFKSTGMDPVFVTHADGKYLYTEEGVKLLDLCMSWGAVILGHNSKIVKDALSEALDDGTSFGFSHRYEAILAELIISCMPSIEKIRFVNSGTEALMSAVRIARAFTRRSIVVKFDGCYHGHSDSFLVNAGSGAGEISNASSKGVTPGTVSDTVSVPYNDFDAVKNLFMQRGKEIACVVIEPVAGNMGLVPPIQGFLSFLRDITRENGALLLFDEVITGFRVGLSGVQGIENIVPDITTLGKIIGGGLPVGAFGGRADIMDQLAPLGDVYQAGTLSGNPLAMRAGIAVVSELRKNPEIYTRMSLFSAKLKNKMSGKPGLVLNTYHTIFTIFYSGQPVHSFRDAQNQDAEQFRKYFKRFFNNGILIPPSMYETSFFSALHDEDDVKKIISCLSNR